MSNLTQKQINANELPLRTKHIRLELLDYKLKTIDTLEAVCIGGSLSKNANDNLRRSGNISIAIPIDSKADTFFNAVNGLTVCLGGKIWLDRYIKIFVGIEENGEVVWYKFGICLIDQPSKTVNATTYTITFNVVDLMAKLTGLRQGQLPSQTIAIPKGEIINGKYVRTETAEALKSVIKDLTTFDKFSVYPIPSKLKYLPYDIKVSVGATVYDIIKEFMDILSTWQIYFNDDGILVIEPIPYSTQDITLPIEYDTLISTDTSYDFQNVKNQIVTYGRLHSATYYTDKIEYISDGIIRLTFDAIKTDNWVINGTTLCFNSGNFCNENNLTNVEIYSGDTLILAREMGILVDFEGQNNYIPKRFIKPNDIYAIRILNGTLNKSEQVITELPVTFEFLGKQQVADCIVNDNKESPFYINASIDNENYYCGEAYSPSGDLGNIYELTLNNDKSQPLDRLNDGTILTFMANATNNNNASIKVYNSNGTEIAQTIKDYPYYANITIPYSTTFNFSGGADDSMIYYYAEPNGTSIYAFNYKKGLYYRAKELDSSPYKLPLYASYATTIGDTMFIYGLADSKGCCFPINKLSFSPIGSDKSSSYNTFIRSKLVDLDASDFKYVATAYKNEVNHLYFVGETHIYDWNRESDTWVTLETEAINGAILELKAFVYGDAVYFTTSYDNNKQTHIYKHIVGTDTVDLFYSSSYFWYNSALIGNTLYQINNSAVMCFNLVTNLLTEVANPYGVGGNNTVAVGNNIVANTDTQIISFNTINKTIKIAISNTKLADIRQGTNNKLVAVANGDVYYFNARISKLSKYNVCNNIIENIPLSIEYSDSKLLELKKMFLVGIGDTLNICSILTSGRVRKIPQVLSIHLGGAICQNITYNNIGLGTQNNITDNGVTYTYNNETGIITCNGTATADSEYLITQQFVKSVPLPYFVAKDWLGSCLTTSERKTSFVAYLIKDDGTTTEVTAENITQTIFSSADDYKYIQLKIKVASGVTVDNETKLVTLNQFKYLRVNDIDTIPVYGTYNPPIETSSLASDYTIYKLKYTNGNFIVLGRHDGAITSVNSGGEFDNIYSDQLAKERNQWELYKHSNLNDSIKLDIVPNYYIDVNQKFYAPSWWFEPVEITGLVNFATIENYTFTTSDNNEFIVGAYSELANSKPYLTKQISYSLAVDNTAQSINAIALYENENLTGTSYDN